MNKASVLGCMKDKKDKSCLTDSPVRHLRAGACYAVHGPGQGGNNSSQYEACICVLSKFLFKLEDNRIYFIYSES